MVTENLQTIKVSVSSLVVRNGIYQAVLEYYDEKGKRQQPWRSTGLKERGNKKQAMAKAEEIRANLEKQLNLKALDNPKSNNNPKDILFIEYLLYWLEITRHNVEASTFTSYRQMTNNHIKRYFTENPIKLVELSAIHIQTFYNELMIKYNLSANTVIHHHAIIRKCLDYAFKMDIIPNNPADKIQRPKMEQFIGSFYTESELNTLFEKSKGDPLELVVLVTAFYGLRRSEVLGLQWDSFDFENKTITIKHTITITNTDGNNRKIEGKDRTKNKSSYRTLPLFDDIADKLLEFKEKQESFKKAFGNSYNKNYLNYVFVNPQGKLLRPDYVTEHFSILLKKIGLKHIRFHDLRHSCASLLLAKDIKMKAIQEWLGHSCFSTTANLYAHLDSKSKQESAEALVNALKVTDTNKKENEESTSSSSQNN
ncbi:MAG: site-specific integrase [Clostridia bacterium]|nr:site-specific integrase [Clostridia bacterium]